MSFDFTASQAEGLPSFARLNEYWRDAGRTIAYPLNTYADGKGMSVQAKQYDRACRLIVGMREMLRR